MGKMVDSRSGAGTVNAEPGIYYHIREQGSYQALLKSYQKESWTMNS